MEGREREIREQAKVGFRKKRRKNFPSQFINRDKVNTVWSDKVETGRKLKGTQSTISFLCVHVKHKRERGSKWGNSIKNLWKNCCVNRMRTSTLCFVHLLSQLLVHGLIFTPLWALCGEIGKWAIIVIMEKCWFSRRFKIFFFPHRFFFSWLGSFYSLSRLRT